MSQNDKCKDKPKAEKPKVDRESLDKSMKDKERIVKNNQIVKK